MAWRSPRSQNGPEPTGGEYVVRHERPYPHRLDRAFRIGAIVVAVGTGIGTVWFLLAAVPGAFASLSGGTIDVGVALLIAALAYGFTRAVGMIAVGTVGGFRRKAYVIDWDEQPPGR